MNTFSTDIMHILAPIFISLAIIQGIYMGNTFLIPTGIALGIITLWLKHNLKQNK